MTITLSLDAIAAFVTEHPWPAVTLVFLLGVILPAIWSTRCWRRRAAMTVIRALADTCTAVAAIATGLIDSPRHAAARGKHTQTERREHNLRKGGREVTRKGYRPSSG